MKHTFVTLVERTSTTNGAVTFSLRWRMGVHQTSGLPKWHTQHVLRTEREPNKIGIRKWRVVAVQARYDKERELNQDCMEYVHYRKRVTGAKWYIGRMDGHLADLTVDRQQATLARFNEYADGRGFPVMMSGLKVHHIAAYRDYLTERGLTASSINTQLSTISAWLKWGLGESFNWHNPAANVNRVLAKGTRQELAIRTAREMWDVLNGLTDDPVSAIYGRLHCTAKYKRAVIGTIACTGMRKAEAWCLEHDAWDPWSDPAMLQIGLRYDDTERTKRHRRLLPVCETAAGWLRDLAVMNDKGPWLMGVRAGQVRFREHANKWLRPWGLTCQALRCWYRTALETADVREYAIDYLLGHMGSKIRRSYTPSENIEVCIRAVRRFETWFASGRPDTGS